MQWSHRFYSTLYYRAPTAIADGDYSYGSWTAAKARIEQYPSIVKTTGGEESVTTHQVATETDIPEQAQVDITGSTPSDTSNALRVLRKEEAYGLDAGYTLYILTLGR